MQSKSGKYEFLAEPFHCDFTQHLLLGHLGNHLLNAADFHSGDHDVENGNINGSVSGTAGTLNMKGSSLNPQTITGSVGNIDDFNIKSGTTTVNGDINATNTNLSANTTLNAEGDITGNI